MGTPKGVMVGEKYGRLTVLQELRILVQPAGARRRIMICKCECGEEIETRADYLRNGHTQSCGCLNRQLASIRNATHGEARGGSVSSEYGIWSGMIARTENPNCDRYSDYGGRGIKICDRWRHGESGKSGFECFLADMGRKPSADHSIDRYPDNDGNYELSNCRWATREQQAANRRQRAAQSRDANTGRFVS